MNCDVRDDAVWTGRPRVSPGAPPWSGSSAGCTAGGAIETGYTRGEAGGELEWGGIRLLDAFEKVHQGGEVVGLEGRCTSRNAMRCEWIDMMFYSPATLDLRATSENGTPPTPMPSRDEPSDHTPIAARFRLPPASL